MTDPHSHINEELRQEGVCIATYLLQRQPVDTVVERYIKGTQLLFKCEANPFERKISDFIRLHPKSIQYFDAVAAVVSRKNILRSKILLMTAIIETTPEYCDEFFPVSFNKSKFFLKLISTGFRTAWQLSAGTILTLWLRIQRV